MSNNITINLVEKKVIKTQETSIVLEVFDDYGTFVFDTDFDANIIYADENEKLMAYFNLLKAKAVENKQWEEMLYFHQSHERTIVVDGKYIAFEVWKNYV